MLMVLSKKKIIAGMKFFVTHWAGSLPLLPNIHILLDLKIVAETHSKSSGFGQEKL